MALFPMARDGRTLQSCGERSKAADSGVNASMTLGMYSPWGSPLPENPRQPGSHTFFDVLSIISVKT